mgnify:CR=1 FL=1
MKPTTVVHIEAQEVEWLAGEFLKISDVLHALELAGYRAEAPRLNSLQLRNIAEGLREALS